MKPSCARISARLETPAACSKRELKRTARAGSLSAPGAVYVLQLLDTLESGWVNHDCPALVAAFEVCKDRVRRDRCLVKGRRADRGCVPRLGRVAVVSSLRSASAIAQPAPGRLWEGFGPRRVFLTGVSAFGGIGSDASSAVVSIAFRAGAGGSHRRAVAWITAAVGARLDRSRWALEVQARWLFDEQAEHEPDHFGSCKAR
jgi:hypothetical protein